MLIGQYLNALVWISILVAILASYTAISLVGRVAHSTEHSARWWIGGGAVAMGTGIWSMHFIGMLAFRLPIPIGYDLAITLLSWVVPVMVSGLALWQVHCARTGFRQLAVSAVLMGLGIVTMHYVGMAAMRINPGITYQPWLVAASIVIAIAASAASLGIAFYVNIRCPTTLPRLAGALVMGLGIVGMHYTGMASADFPLNSVCLSAGSGLSLDGIALGVVIATIAILGVTLVSSHCDAKLMAGLEIVRVSEQIAQERQFMLDSERAARGEAEAARAHAERASAVKDEFLATLSHELRTPLNAILGWVQLLQVRFKTEFALLDGLRVIERNAHSQVKLIEDLLDMSGMASGKVRLQLQKIDPAQLLNIALDSAVLAAARKAIRIVRLVEGNVGRLRADPERLAQVFGNLLANAIKFTPDNGQIEVALSRVGENIEVRITDTGIGIPDDFLPHVFELFRQADSSTTRRFGGLGIGLTIVRQLVILHGGEVAASSAGQGQGATFTVRLPLLQPDATSCDLAGDAETSLPLFVPVNLIGISVLVVDDEQDAAQLIRSMLEQCGAIVITANSGRAALAELSNQAPDIIVSDIGMPEMDGLELIKLVRRSTAAANESMSAIALSAYTREKDREAALHAGFDRYLSKPVDGSQLVCAIEQLTRNTNRQ